MMGHKKEEMDTEFLKYTEMCFMEERPETIHLRS